MEELEDKNSVFLMEIKFMCSGWKIEMEKDVRQGDAACCPYVCQPVWGRQGWGESPLGSGLLLLRGPLATFLWGVLCAFYKGQSSLQGSSGKMGMTS